MTKIKAVIDYLEEIAPLDLQENYDNAGLIVGDKHKEVTKVLVCLDSVESVVDEAIQIGANLIIAHHPIVFSGLKTITGKTYIERTIIKAIKHDIAIYAIHTNLDNIHKNGVNEQICKKLELYNCSILSPKGVEDTIGSGMIGDLRNEMDLFTFLDHLKQQLLLEVIKHTAPIDRPITKVAVCGGSGSFLTEIAKDKGADVFVSSDYKYHQFFDADNEIVIIDIGHYESEYYTIELIKELLNKKFTTFAAHCTTVVTNPVQYYK